MARRSIPAKGPDWSPEKTLPLLQEQLRQLQAFKGKVFSQVERAEDEWEQFTRSVIIHGFGEESQNISNHYMARSAGIHNMMGISDQQRQLNFQDRISQYEATLNSSIRELEAMLPAPVPNTSPSRASAVVRPSGTAITSDGDQPLILISHSSRDVELASALVDFLRAGLLTNRIRCSSVDGYRLPAGVHTESQLRAEVNSTQVLIGLITPNSLASAYVMFELGARWGAGSFMIPLLAGVIADDIRGPLSGLNALSGNNDAQLHQLLGDVSKALDIHVQRPESYVGQLTILKSRGNDVKPLGQMAAALPKATSVPVEVRNDFAISITVTGDPPSQRLRVKAGRPVMALRLEYLLSTDVCVATDNLNLEGSESFDVPIDGNQVLKLWNTPRADRNFNDHSGPAKLRITLAAGGNESSFTLPIQMNSFFRSNTFYQQLVGSQLFRWKDTE
jgi:hypothetical protein